LEDAVLDLLRNRLMQPDAVSAFVAEFGKELNARNGSATTERQRLTSERTALARKLDGLYDSIADGLRTQVMNDRLAEMEASLAHLDARLLCHHV